MLICVISPEKKESRNFFSDKLGITKSLVDQDTLVASNNVFVYLLLLISVLSKIKYNHDPFKFASFFVLFTHF